MQTLLKGTPKAPQSAATQVKAEKTTSPDAFYDTENGCREHPATLGSIAP